jgi:hypothetical protein
VAGRGALGGRRPAWPGRDGRCGPVVLVLDVPPDEAPWLAVNPAGEWAGEQLRLRKRPLLWSHRPLGWPVWNHQHRRLARYWSAGAGLDDTVIDALRTRQLDRLEVVEPTAEQLARQLLVELPVSRRHLRRVVGPYLDGGGDGSTRATTSLPRTTCGALPQPSPRCRTPSTSSRLTAPQPPPPDTAPQPTSGTPPEWPARSPSDAVDTPQRSTPVAHTSGITSDNDRCQARTPLCTPLYRHTRAGLGPLACGSPFGGRSRDRTGNEGRRKN